MATTEINIYAPAATSGGGDADFNLLNAKKSYILNTGSLTPNSTKYSTSTAMPGNIPLSALVTYLTNNSVDAFTANNIYIEAEILGTNESDETVNIDHILFKFDCLNNGNFVFVASTYSYVRIISVRLAYSEETFAIVDPAYFDANTGEIHRITKISSITYSYIIYTKS